MYGELVGTCLQEPKLRPLAVQKRECLPQKNRPLLFSQSTKKVGLCDTAGFACK